jgi:hypothetical protein
MGGSGRVQPCQQKLNCITEKLTQACSTGLGSIWVASAWKTAFELCSFILLCIINLTVLSFLENTKFVSITDIL